MPRPPAHPRRRFRLHFAVAGALALALLGLAPACQSQNSCRLGLFPHGPDPDADCVSCIQSRCGQTYQACYGPGWPDGEVNGGECQSFARCLEEGTCEVGRIPTCTQSTACGTCAGDGALCVYQQCADACGTFPSAAPASRP